MSIETQSYISKRALCSDRYARPTLSFPNARTAFLAYLRACGISSQDEVLLPAYIGWSANEGSGVFDPIKRIGARFSFYRITRDLRIDLDDLHAKIMRRPRLLVIIHYFGFPDPHLAEVVRQAQSHGVLVLEDEAHAFYSDWIGGVCGRFGEASVFSLHKMLPVSAGGLLVLNVADPLVIANVQDTALQTPLACSPLEYDLPGIAAARRRNAHFLLDQLRGLSDKLSLLYMELPEGVVPQSLPVIVSEQSRDALYFEMNRCGYGVISLYHTLIDQLSIAEFPESHWLAQHILNLPVHQDATTESLGAMLSQLADLLS
jgi:dTDP-4-amino-4,6-dideoxygalactose transaminase